MDRTTIVIITLLVYKLLLIGIGLWASRRNKDEEDFFLGGRGLGPVVAAISYSSSASSAWTLLGLSGAAYIVGLRIVWIALGSIIGMLVAWFWIGPRLRTYSREMGHITLTDFLAQDSGGGTRKAIVICTSVIIIFTFAFYVAAQFQGAGNTFSSTFEMDMTESILLGALIIMIYTLLGGFWAVSVTDTLQGLLMAFTAILLPVAAFIEVGGASGFWQGLQAVSTPEQLSWTGGNTGLLALGVIIGSLSIGFGTYGQPHLLVRFMALRDEKALRQARLITIVWYAIVFGGMVFLGLVGHVLHAGIDNPETIFFALTESLFTPVVGAILLAAVLSAIMSTADSQLLVAASAISHDLKLGGEKHRLLYSRLAIVMLVVFAVIVSLYLPEAIFSRVLFAWIALGSAFGPTVFVRLAGIQVRPVGVLVSILTGFGLAVIFYLMPNTPGDILERAVPFTTALLVLLAFRARPSSTMTPSA